MTNLTPSAANLLATETPCLGSDPSSPYETMIFWPRMPPAALMSAAAWSTPFFICAPVAALGPVIGPPTASLTWADAVPVSAIAKPSAKPSVVILFIAFPLNWNRPTGSPLANATSGRLFAPAQGAVRHVDPAILRDHLRGAGGAKAEQAERHTDRAVDQIIVGRQQGAAEQGEVEEPHDRAQDQAIGNDLSPRPPGGGDGAAGERRRPAAEDDGDQDEHAEPIGKPARPRQKKIQRQPLPPASGGGRRGRGRSAPPPRRRG